MERRINDFQLRVLEYEIDVFPDIIQIALKKMRMKTVLEVSKDKFDRFFRQIQIAKYEKYRNSNGLNGNQQAS